MPRFLKKIFLWFITACLLVHTQLNPLYANTFRGINKYYIRYDVKYSNHQITTNRLTMVPAERDYRPENFSLSPVSHVVRAAPQESKQSLENRVKKNAFTQLLVQKGLKSVSTLNLETIISYEGMVLTPVNIWIGPHDQDLKGYPYTAQINFAPLAFPDKWEFVRQQFKIKETLNDFFLLFK